MRKKKKELPPCDGDCFNCKRPVSQCYGGDGRGFKTPYVKGTSNHMNDGHGSEGSITTAFECGHHVYTGVVEFSDNRANMMHEDH